MGTASRNTTIKIIIGTCFLLLFLFLSVTFIYEEIEKLSDSEDERELKTDSLLLLLKEKDKNTVQMLRMLNEANESFLSVNNLEEIISQKDSFVIQQQVVQYRVVETKDSILNPVTKKKFFKRLAEAFSPTKDTTVIMNSSVEYIVDTLVHEYNPIDSLQKRIQEMNEQNMERQQVIQKNNARLRRLNRELTAQIDSMIRRTENEALSHSQQEVEHQQHLRRQSIRTIGGIAVGAILFSVILLFLIWRDIVRSNRYRKELEEANRLAEELLQTREKLMLAITHDFKAPLSSIIGYSDLLARLLEDGRQQFYMNNIKTSSEHLLKLVNDLLEFHRLDLNKEEIQRVKFNPAHLLEEVKTVFEPLVMDKRLELSTEIDNELDGNFISDPLRIRQILTNLLSNAVKFTVEGSISIKAYYKASQLYIVISDTGKGISAEDKERIFQEFTRLANAQGEEGFGLGLSIVKKLVHLLEGRIEVESTEGEGTIFRIFLPLYSVGESLDLIPESEEELASVEKSLKILIIDDDRLQLSLTTAMLEQQNITVAACEKLDELLECLRRETFDLLLTDIQMPEINGFDLLKLLRSSSIPQMNSIPIVAVTARSEMEEADLCEAGFSGCLHKPFSVKDLSRLINRIFSSDKIAQKNENKEELTPKEVDFSYLTAFCGDDSEASEAIMKTFIKETGKELQRMQEALIEEKIKEIAGIAHKLLPVFRLLHAVQIVSLLENLENQQIEDFTGEIIENTKKVITEIQKVLDKAAVL